MSFPQQLQEGEKITRILSAFEKSPDSLEYKRALDAQKLLNSMHQLTPEELRHFETTEKWGATLENARLLAKALGKASKPKIEAASPSPSPSHE